MLGWTVLNHLKLDPATRHIPVQIITLEEERQHGLAHGAFSYLVKAPTTEARGGLRSHQGLHARRAPSGCWSSRTTRSSGRVDRRAARPRRHRDRGRRQRAARRSDALREQPSTACVLDLRLPDMTGFELLERMHAEPALVEVPVVVFTGKELSARRAGAAQDHGQEHRAQGRAVARATAGRDGAVPAPRGHRICRRRSRRMLERLHGSNEVLRGRKVLVVDDDARNIFALTSLLENQDMEVISATNGRAGHRHHQVDAGPEHRADGHHDARDGRLRDHAGDPQRPRVPQRCRSWP